MAWEFELVAGPYGGTTEGPAWDGQALLFTHIPNNRIMRYDPTTGACAEFRTGTNATNGLMFDAQGRLYGCSGGGRYILRFEPDGILFSQDERTLYVVQSDYKGVRDLRAYPLQDDDTLGQCIVLHVAPIRG